MLQAKQQQKGGNDTCFGNVKKAQLSGKGGGLVLRKKNGREETTGAWRRPSLSWERFAFPPHKAGKDSEPDLWMMRWQAILQALQLVSSLERAPQISHRYVNWAGISIELWSRPECPLEHFPKLTSVLN